MMNMEGGGGGVVGSTMSLPTKKTNEVVGNVNGGLVSRSDEFPVGLRVLVVDDDPTCLTILEKMLRTCRYQVTKTSRAEIALSLLRENRNGFDVVISDVHMPDMDGFKLLECVGLEMDLPVIMMSADDSKHVVMKGVRHGACDYLIKPVRIEALKNIWQHVVRKKRSEQNVEKSGSWDEGDKEQKQDDAVSSPATDGGWKSSKRKGEEEESDEKDDTNTLKKPRVVWSVELHQQFVAAVNQLGIDKAVPKKILELMNVPGITRENVASHLQKYRLYLRRLSGVSQHQGGSFMPQDSGFSSMSSLGGVDLQILAATGQLSAQALAAYTRMTPGIKPGMSMPPFIDQRNLFSFENSKLRYGEGHQQLGNIDKQMNLLHGIPTNMEPKQLVGLNQSGRTLGNVNMQANPPSSHQNGSLLMQMMPQQSRGQTMHSNVVANGVLSRNGIPYNPVSQATSVVDFSVNHIPDLPGSGFPLGSTPGITSMNSNGFDQDGISANAKATRGYNASYDVYGGLTNPGMTFGGSPQLTTPMQNTVNVVPSVVVNQPYKQNENMHSLGANPIFSAGLENQNLDIQTSNQSFNDLVDNSLRVKAETISDVVSSAANFFPEHYGQDDLMSALLKQQQEGVAPGEFDFDGYTLENIPV